MNVGLRRSTPARRTIGQSRFLHRHGILTLMSIAATPRVAAPLFDVVIVGSGLVGCALAVALASGLPSSFRVALLDRGSGQKSAGDARAVALSAASVRLLRGIGVWQRVEPLAQPVSRIDITDSALKAGIRPVLLSYATELQGGEASAYIMLNAALETALSAAAAAHAGIEVITNAEVTGFKTNTETSLLTLACGRTLSARLVVAADGRRSKLRELAGIGTVGWPYEQRGITVVMAHSEPHGGCAVQHFLPGGPFAMLPLPGNRTCVTWSEATPVAERMIALNDSDFLREVDQRVGGRLGLMEIAGRRQSWPLEVFLARSFAAERLALAGDSAHNVHPIAGQGLNLGLKDVAALAEVVVDQARVGLDIGAPAVLARYEQWRRFDTFTAAASFDALNRLFSNDGGLLRAVRSLGLDLVDRFPVLKRRLVAEAAGTTGNLPRLIRGEAL